jgi:death on curing protein
VRLGRVVFLDVGDVVYAHALGLSRYGGLDGVRDAGALEAAVMAPRATFGGEPLYPSLAQMAAAYVFGIARAHAFLDGNKRAAIMAAGMFLEAHGFAIALGPEWVDLMVRVVEEPRFSRDELAERFAVLMGNDGAIEPDP